MKNKMRTRSFRLDDATWDRLEQAAAAVELRGDVAGMVVKRGS